MGSGPATQVAGLPEPVASSSGMSITSPPRREGRMHWYSRAYRAGNVPAFLLPKPLLLTLLMGMSPARDQLQPGNFNSP